MKIGCAVWTFTAPNYNPPYEQAIETIGELGFDAVELILWDPEDLEAYWTEKKVDELRKLCESYYLAVSEFAVYRNVVPDLASLDLSRKERSLAAFGRACLLARALGTDTINMVAHWPDGLKAPVPYPPAYIHVNVPGYEGFEPKFKMELPDGFDWDTIWENYVDTVRQVVSIASSYGLRVALEGHAHVIVPHTDSFLRLFDCVPDSRLGVNFDTGWQFIQREHLPWSIHKLKERIFHIHARDGDGLACYSLPIGDGILDWQGIARALKEVGYTGFLSLELGHYADPYFYAKRSLDFLRAVIGES